MDNVLQILIDNKNTPYDLTFKKALFEYYKNHNYTRNSLNDLGRLIDIRPSVLKVFIYSYANEKLKMNSYEFDEYKKSMQEKNESINIKTENFILNEKGIKTTLLWNNEEEKVYFLNKIYEYSRKHNFTIKSTKEISEKLNIAQSKYLDLIEEYINNYKNDTIDPDRLKELVFQKTNRVRMKNDRLRSCYKRIIESSSPEEVDMIVEESEYSNALTYLKDNFPLYADFYTEEEANKFYEKFQEFKDYHTQKLKNIRSLKRQELEREKNKEKLVLARKIINEYLYHNNKSFLDFLYRHNITDKDFNDYVNCIKEYDNELYLDYEKLKNQKKLEDKNNLVNEIKYISKAISNGIEENGKKRSFDIVDYFQTTSIPLWCIVAESNNLLNRNEQCKLKQFKMAYKDAELYNSTEEKIIKDEKRVVGVQFDKFGKIIEGSGRIITDEEKNYLLDFLSKNGISINRKTYNAVLKRYLNGFISIDEEKKLILK